MTNIYERFAALPRARRGDKTVVIVDEDVLMELIAAAQESEAALVFSAVRAGAKPAPRPPASGGSAIVVNVTSSGHEINLLDDIRNSIVAQQHNNALARRSRSW